MASPRAALAALRVPGVAAGLAAAHDLDLLLAFGSAVRDGGEPRDLDLAALSRARLDPLRLLHDLYGLTTLEAVDLLDLRRAGPVARFEALDGGVILFEARPGLFAGAHMAAVAQKADTAEFRRRVLAALAG